MVIKQYVKDNIAHVQETLKKFKKINVAVIGDIMVDDYLFGGCSRLSPEAPVPVVEVAKREYRLGGASNVAKNIVALGGHAHIFGVIGNDGVGRLALDELEKHKINNLGVFSDSERPTTQKTRIIAHNQQIARTDIERRHPINNVLRTKIIKKIIDNVNEYDAFIISDYAKGVISKDFLDEILPQLVKRKKIITVDPKTANFYHYREVTSITPNRKELADVLGKTVETNEKIITGGRALMNDLSLKSLLVTLGEGGMCLFTNDGQEVFIPTVARSVYDVTGAGDTVISVFTMALAAGADFKSAAIISNFAAGEVVGMLGTSTIDINQLKHAIQKFK
ncbi:MAG: D-glycero-beta-D-manno-heptose-7-phosphate kinase [Candidatus Wallbacteria bacterium]